MIFFKLKNCNREISHSPNTILVCAIYMLILGSDEKADHIITRQLHVNVPHARFFHNPGMLVGRGAYWNRGAYKYMTPKEPGMCLLERAGSLKEGRFQTELLPNAQGDGLDGINHYL